MKKGVRRSGAQTNYTQRNYAQGSHHKEDYNNHRKQQYREQSSNYYMYTANAVARDYDIYEEEQNHGQQVRKPKVKKRPALLQHVSTVAIVFLLGLALVVQYTAVQSLGYQVSQTKNELKAVQDQNEKIKKQIAVLGELQTVEALAINNMGMRKPADWEIIYLPQESAQEPEAEESTVDQAVDDVKEVLGTIIH